MKRQSGGSELGKDRGRDMKRGTGAEARNIGPVDRKTGKRRSGKELEGDDRDRHGVPIQARPDSIDPSRTPHYFRFPASGASSSLGTPSGESSQVRAFPNDPGAIQSSAKPPPDRPIRSQRRRRRPRERFGSRTGPTDPDTINSWTSRSPGRISPSAGDQGPPCLNPGLAPEPRVRPRRREPR